MQLASTTVKHLSGFPKQNCSRFILRNRFLERDISAKLFFFSIVVTFSTVSWVLFNSIYFKRRKRSLQQIANANFRRHDQELKNHKEHAGTSFSNLNQIL